MHIDITKAPQSRIDRVDFDDVGFGHVFSDHMFMVEYSKGKWGTPRIVPYGTIEVAPSLCVLHYGQAIFEGLKAYYTATGAVNLFRPQSYHARFNRSGARLAIPPVDWEMFIGALTELLKLDREWIPKKDGYSLYIRPFIFASENFLGVHVSDSYMFMIITGPVGAYYKEGLNPVSLTTPGGYVRAVRGGLGEAKTPGNYAGSLLPADEAQKNGYTQVLWLDGVELKYVEEVGTMNIMFVIGDEIITPPLGGSVLGGITRDSVIQLAKHWNIPIQERKISIQEIFAEAKAGRLKEVFGTGTAAVISPVGRIHHEGETITINEGKIGTLSQRLYDEITGIQYAKRPDPLGWTYSLG